MPRRAAPSSPASGRPSILSRVDAVQRHVDRFQAGLGEGSRHGREQDAVRGQSEGREASHRGEIPDKAEYAFSHEGLATGDAHLVDAQVHRRADYPREILEA